MDNRRIQGNAAEDRAVQFYLARGYVLKDRNVRNRKGEIDLIFRYNQDLVFVEVRSRKSPNLNQDYGIEATMPPQKIIQFKRLVEIYMKWNREPADQVRLYFYIEYGTQITILEVPVDC